MCIFHFPEAVSEIAGANPQVLPIYVAPHVKIRVFFKEGGEDMKGKYKFTK